MNPTPLDRPIGSGATGVMDWHTRGTAPEFVPVEVVDTISLEVGIMFSVPRLKVNRIGRGVPSVSCSGLVETLLDRVPPGIRTPRKDLAIILFRFFEELADGKSL